MAAARSTSTSRSSSSRGWLHDGGQPALALPPLGSALWDPATTAHVSAARLSNQALLDAVHHLAFVEDGRRPVDFRNLGSEELGSVYESLLELHPVIERESATFTLATAAGHERKQTGSYYTPTQLIGSLLESALDPVIERAARSADPEQALLDLTVCDPACGSGHFLIAAANRIAKRLGGGARGRSAARPGGHPPRAARCHRALHPRRRRQPDGRRAVQGLTVAGGARARAAAVVPRRPHPARQQPARHDSGAHRRWRARRRVQAVARRRTRDTVKDHKRRNAAERKSRQTAMGLGAAEDATALSVAAIAVNAIDDGLARRRGAPAKPRTRSCSPRRSASACAWPAMRGSLRSSPHARRSPLRSVAPRRRCAICTSSSRCRSPSRSRG